MGSIVKVNIFFSQPTILIAGKDMEIELQSRGVDAEINLVKATFWDRINLECLTERPTNIFFGVHIEGTS